MAIPCQIPILDTDNVLLCRFFWNFMKWQLWKESWSPRRHIFHDLWRGKNAYLLSKCDPLWRKRRAKLNKVLEFHWKKSVYNSTIDSVTAECRGSNDLFTFLETFFLVGKSNGTFDNLNFLEIFFFDSDPSFWKKGNRALYQGHWKVSQTVLLETRPSNLKERYIHERKHSCFSRWGYSFGKITDAVTTFLCLLLLCYTTYFLCKNVYFAPFVSR